MLTPPQLQRMSHVLNPITVTLIPLCQWLGLDRGTWLCPCLIDVRESLLNSSLERFPSMVKRESWTGKHLSSPLSSWFGCYHVRISCLEQLQIFLNCERKTERIPEKLNQCLTLLRPSINLRTTYLRDSVIWDYP